MGPRCTGIRAIRALLVRVGTVVVPLASTSCLVLDGFADLERAEGAGGSASSSTASATSAPASGSTGSDGRGGSGVGGDASGGGGAGGGVEGRVRVYVSATTGSDMQGDGLSPEQPRRTILGALGVLDALGAEGDVLVCEGTYGEEELRIDRRISLLGGFDCETWDRPQESAAPYFPRAVVIEGRPARPALVLEGPAVDGDTLIEGVTIRGGLVAVDVVAGAAPRIEKCVLEGGSTEEGPSIGLRVDGDPHLDRVELLGGTGHATGDLPGSAGLVVVGGAPVLESTGVRGKKGFAGTEGLASVGLLVLDGSLVSASALRDLSISGGEGDSSNPDITTAGIAILGGDVAIESVVVGGGVPLTSTSGSTAVLVQTTGEVTIARAVLNGGSSRPSTTARGVHARAAARLDVVNSMIVGGIIPGGVDDVATIGVHLDGSDDDALGDVSVLHTTIQAQHVAPATARPAAAVVVGRSGVVTLGNDLFFTAVDVGGVAAIHLETCPPDARVSGNAFLAIDPLLTQGADGCAAFNGAASTSSLESNLVSYGFEAEQNLYLGGCAKGVPQCEPLQCTGPASCTAAVFDGWASLSQTLVTGFRLNEGLACRLVESGQDFDVMEDWAGDARVGAPSMGADEVEGCGGGGW